MAEEEKRETEEAPANPGNPDVGDSGARTEAPRRRRRALTIALVIALVAIAGAGVAIAASQPGPVEPSAPTAPTEAQDEKSDVLLTVEAEGAQAGTTKVKALAVDDKNRIAIAETEIEANAETSIGQLPAGDYELYVTAAPVCEDGSSYKLPEEPAAFTVKGDDMGVPVSVKLDKLAVEDMTKEQMEAAASVLEASGKADAAAGVRDKAQRAPSAPGSEGAVVSGHEASGTSPSASPTTQPSTSGNSDSNGGSSSTQAPAQHTHSWVHHDAVYKTVHHDAVYNTVHHDAVTESIVVCLDCGLENPGRDHLKQHVIEGGNGGTTVKTNVISSAYDEQVLVSAAYDEQVLVSNAYDSCSCGATK